MAMLLHIIRKELLDQMLSLRFAIACVVFGRWSPYRALAGALLFGAMDALQLRFQAAGVPLPFQILSMLPYIATILALMSVSRNARLPAALCIPYVRGEK